MLVMDGFVICWVICVLFGCVELLVLVLIVYSYSGDCECCLVVGMSDYMVKLVKFEEL